MGNVMIETTTPGRYGWQNGWPMMYHTSVVTMPLIMDTRQPSFVPRFQYTDQRIVPVKQAAMVPCESVASVNTPAGAQMAKT